ncbi:metallophosphoesterase family protein [Xanthomonas campestris]|uniref:metallophosphoesterase family protein n=1 Tax=Xanthomonas campestris TaxID=339 RepID=UPI001F367BBA|nr:DNA repair exonuclease [Xanthomonas campestris]MEB1101554.1 DNA repair exonuclease [Xanthomonas campestris pv. campestris]MEB1181678.1 DNA repair exonuclease [Xanthomonas campestris pv. campestris]MEB1432029.1 DNA repair exonuclease [Xanthomonas campestris pv. campestris]MEB1997447.1 DNA repair exonuclease [Xanthomonas campestris pv. campestris]MEB2006150.1 DNA repair exonuclease [Xanthomonas campestris pv. campestris]
MPKFLHTADWQIGKQFGGFEPDDAALLAKARIDGISAIAELAAAEQVDGVLVPGDVFDAQMVADKTIQQAFRAMEPYPGPWFLLPGNHDAGLIESVWTRAQRLGAVPANAVLCLTPTPVPLLGGRVVVLPAPLTQRNTFADLTVWFDHAATDPGVIRVGLAHGSAQGVLHDGIDSANPIAAGRADSARLDYLALGDWHGTAQVDAKTWYSGTHEQDRFRGNDPGNVLIVEVEAGQAPKVRPVRIGRHRWQQIEVALQVTSDIEALEATLENLSAADVVDLTVTGAVDLASRERLLRVVSRAQGRALALRWDLAGLQLLPSPEDIASLRADGYLADAIEELRDAQTLDGNAGDLARDSLILLATTMRGVNTTGASA